MEDRLISVRSCIDYLESVLHDRGLLSPSTAVILDSCMKHLGDSVPKTNDKGMVSVMKKVLIEEIPNLKDGTAEYFADRMLAKLKEEKVI